MISIILPIYNMQDYIAECLESVINQTYKDIEIICVNDFSMDNSMTIVKEYAKRDNRIKIVNNEKNRGLGGARNAGIDIAKGEYIMFIDTDDKMMPDMAEKLYININKEESDMAFCDVMLLNADRSLTSYKPFHDMKISCYNAFFPQKNFENFTNIWPSAWNKIYKTSIIKEKNLRYLENILYEDHTFYYQYLLNCKKVSHINMPLYIYRHERPDSIMKETSPRIFEIFIILQYIEDIFKSNFDSDTCNKFMTKITLRLLWERTMSFNAKKKTEIQKEFIKKAHKAVLKYKFSEILKYKDPFIENTLFLKLKKENKIFSKKYNKLKTQYNLLGIKFSIADKKSLFKAINELEKEKIQLKSKLENLEENYLNVQNNINQLIKSKFKRYNYKKITDIKNQNININTELKKLGKFYFIPNPGNLGDVVIAQAEYELLNSKNFDYDIVDFENKFLPYSKEFNLVYGGGGLFVKFWGYDNFLKVFKKQNLKSCVILPSSFYKCDDLLEVFDERFIVFCREKNSYKYCIEKNKRAKFILADDMALFIETSTNVTTKNNLSLHIDNLGKSNIFDKFLEGYFKYKEVETNIKNALECKTIITSNDLRIGYVFRNDEERKQQFNIGKDKIIDLSMFSTSSCTSSGDVKLLSELFIKAINSFDVVFTDRLHVGIVSSLLRKKAYLIDNVYGKVSGVYNYSLKDFNNVNLIDSLEEIKIDTLDFKGNSNLEIFNTNLEYSDFICKYLANENVKSNYTNTISKWGNISE